MKHLIIGSGVIGKATGTWLEANNEDVTYHDTNKDVIQQLKNNNKKIHDDCIGDFDIFWICTVEWDVTDIFKKLSNNLKDKKIIVIRSTMPIGSTKKLQKQYTLLAHNPEFLRAKTAIDDMFHPDRIVIGTDSEYVKEVMKKIYKNVHVPVLFTDTTTSEMIKLVSNAWLSTQISFWNQIKMLCDSCNINSQEVANGCALDKRISKYGTNMIGESYSGFCLPKDINSLIKIFEFQSIKPTLLKAVKEVNDDFN